LKTSGLSTKKLVARAICASKIPVIAGIGHETDFTIADFAADLRAPTPTAAAELVSPDRAGLLIRLDALESQLQRRQERSLADRQQRLDWLSARLIHPAERLRQRRQDTDALGARLQRAQHNQIERTRLQIATLAQRQTTARPRLEQLGDSLAHLRYRLDHRTRWTLSQHSGKLNSLTASLRQLDPHAVLTRGYALAIAPDGRAIRDATALTPGDTLHLSFARGAATATVEQVVATPEAD
jgi:exodeoxyribonuclease VII large subunit